MKRWFLLFCALILAACAPTARIDQSRLHTRAAPTLLSTPAEPTEALTPLKPMMKTGYPDLGPAPELSGDVWLNADGPLGLADLRGKVVLVDMWTFG